MTEKKESAPGAGHNSEPMGVSAMDDSGAVGGVAGKRILSFIERIERLSEEKAALAEDIKEVYAEAKGTGFDAPTLRKIVAERKKEPEKRNEQLELFELYKSAIGMH